ncbi:MAG: hypothetical protein ACKOQ4_02165 [Mycobacterium sp.]
MSRWYRLIQGVGGVCGGAGPGGGASSGAGLTGGGGAAVRSRSGCSDHTVWSASEAARAQYAGVPVSVTAAAPSTAQSAPRTTTGRSIRADQYALAATAFHLLTGSAPFEHSNPAVVIGQHLSEPPPVASLPADLSAFGPVFAKAMAKDPADRYESCADFARAMQQALQPSAGLPPPAGGSARHRRSESAPGGRGPGQRWLAVGLGVLVLAGVAGAAVLVAGQRGAGDADAPPTTPPPPPPAVSARMDLPVVVR